MSTPGEKLELHRREVARLTATLAASSEESVQIAKSDLIHVCMGGCGVVSGFDDDGAWTCAGCGNDVAVVVGVNSMQSIIEAFEARERRYGLRSVTPVTASQGVPWRVLACAAAREAAERDCSLIFPETRSAANLLAAGNWVRDPLRPGGFSDVAAAAQLLLPKMEAAGWYPPSRMNVRQTDFGEEAVVFWDHLEIEAWFTIESSSDDLRVNEASRVGEENRRLSGEELDRLLKDALLNAVKLP